MPNKNGLFIAVPTSVAATGTGSSASIGTNGTVSFTDCVTLSINGVFTSEYDNYMVVARYWGGAGTSYAGYYRLRASGVDASSAAYTWNTTGVNDTSVSGARTEDDTKGYAFIVGANQRSGAIGFIYNPFTTIRTTSRFCNGGNASTGVVTWEIATRHTAASSYDGISFLPEGDKFSGKITIYGMRK